MAEKRIGDTVYRWDRLPADRSVALLARLLKIVGHGPELIAIVTGVDDEPSVFGAICDLGSRLGPDDIEIVMEVVRMCRADGEPVVIGVKPEALEEMLEVFAWALQTEYGAWFADTVATLSGQTSRISDARTIYSRPHHLV